MVVRSTHQLHDTLDRERTDRKMSIEIFFISVALLSIISFVAQQPTNALDQAVCFEMANSPNNETIWREAGLDMNLDWVMKCGDIVAYKLLWPETSEWSDWFVTGVNDLSPFSANRPTRMWSLFADHYHIFIICKSHRNKLTGDKC